MTSPAKGTICGNDFHEVPALPEIRDAPDYGSARRFEVRRVPFLRRLRAEVSVFDCGQVEAVGEREGCGRHERQMLRALRNALRGFPQLGPAGLSARLPAVSRRTAAVARKHPQLDPAHWQ